MREGATIRRIVSRRSIAIAAALALAVFAVYAPVVDYDFVDYDDREYVFENPHVQAGLSWATIRWAATARVVSHWHPLTMLSHALDWECFGAWAGGHHAVNVALHALNAALLFLLLVRTTGASMRSAVVAALFALHPLRVESVAWVAERKDVLSAAFFLLALHAYVGWVRRPSRVRYATMAALFAGGLLAKPMVLTLPFVALLFDAWPLRRVGALRARVAEKVPLFVLAAGSVVATVLAARAAAMLPFAHVSPGLRVANALVALRWYLQATVWPANLGVLYLHPAAPGSPALTGAGVATSLLLVAAMSALVMRESARRPYLVTGWGWYLVMLLPVLGLVQAGLQARADRYTYLPVIGVLIMVVWRTADAFERPAAGIGLRRVGAVVLGLILLASAWRTRAQLRVWHDSEALFRHATAVEPWNFMMHYNLGTALVGRQRHAEAIVEFERAVSLHPGYPAAHRALGDALEHVGRIAEAIREQREAVRLDSTDAAAARLLADALLSGGESAAAIEQYRVSLALDDRDAHTHNNLGNALLAAGDEAGARAAYERAVELDPTLAGARGNLAERLETEGRWDAALPHRLAHARLDPSSADAQEALAVALLHEDHVDEALGTLRTAHRLAPDRPSVRRMLAWVLATRREGTAADGAEALRVLAEGSSPSTDDTIGLATRAVAEAAVGRYDDALATVARARAAAVAADDAAWIAALDDMRRRFEHGEPYRDGS